MPHIIGIGGCSRSGKSNLAKSIKDHLPQKKVLVLDMDEFVFPASQIPKIKSRTDWERPESVNYLKLIQTIHQSVDFHVIVVEGILIFADPRLLELFDSTIWLQISWKTFFERRRNETRWGDEPDWFLEHVWESYLQYGQYPNADFKLSGESPISDEVVSKILRAKN